MQTRPLNQEKARLKNNSWEESYQVFFTKTRKLHTIKGSGYSSWKINPDNMATLTPRDVVRRC